MRWKCKRFEMEMESRILYEKLKWSKFEIMIEKASCKFLSINNVVLWKKSGSEVVMMKIEILFNSQKFPPHLLIPFEEWKLQLKVNEVDIIIFGGKLKSLLGPKKQIIFESIQIQFISAVK